MNKPKNDIERLREKLKLNQTEFGALIGVLQPCVSKLESGRNLPRYDVLAALRIELGVDINKLIDSSGLEMTYDN